MVKTNVFSYLNSPNFGCHKIGKKNLFEVGYSNWLWLQGRDFGNDVVFISSNILMNAHEVLPFLLE
jgi:hypothetical protein